MKALKQLTLAILLLCALFLLLRTTVYARDTQEADGQDGVSVTHAESEADSVLPSYDIEGSEQSFVARDGGGVVYAERASLDELLSVLPCANLHFEEIRSDAPLTLTRSFTISGELSVPALLIEGGASVSALDITIYGALFVRNGSFTMASGDILAPEGSAVTLDYMASASFHMLGGRVYSEKSPAIYAPLGSVLIGGGSVESTGEHAIYTSATLTLYGTPSFLSSGASIESTRPLHLRYGEEIFLGHASVRMDAIFRKGSFSLVAYGATEAAAKSLTLFDREGKAASLCFFEKSTQTKEENVLAVALPYEISFVSGTREFEKLSLYEGEQIAFPEAPAHNGFRFVGYRDADGSPCEDRLADGDALFYADYALMPPTFTLCDLSFIYDGTSHLLAIENLSHPLKEEGYFSYTWYYNGEILKVNAPSLAVKDTKESGSYRVTICFTHKAESVSIESEEITLTISPMTVTAPTLADKIYDATHLFATVPSSPYYTVKKNEGGTGVGKYEVVLVLNDPKNTVWASSLTDTVSVPFYIRKATNCWLSSCWVKDAYLGKMPEHGGHAAFGESLLEYAKAEEGPYSAVLPGTAGIYFVRVRVAGSSNYTELVSEPMQIELFANRVIAIRIEKLPDCVSYTAFEEVDLSGIAVSATYLDGSVLSVDARSLGIIYDTYTSYLSGKDSGVTLTYGEARARLPLGVSKAEFDLSGFAFNDHTAAYTGALISLTPEGEIPVGIDGTRLSYTVEGGGENVGSYAVKLIFSCESENYTIPPIMNATLTIIPQKVELTWKMLTFVYDGSIKTPTAEFTNAFGETVLTLVSGGEIKAGDGYIASAEEPSGNYSFVNPTAAFRIERAYYDMSGVCWSASSFSYDGIEKNVTLIGLPEGVCVEAYTGNRATDAGEYTASAMLLYDEENYHAPHVNDCPWQILRAVYDFSALEIQGGSFVYDGELHYPTVLGELPMGCDGIAPGVTFSGGVREVNEGRVRVEAVFSTDSKNYHTPESIFVEVWIVPAPIAVEWTELSFVYDGEGHLPRASHASVSVSVAGSATDAGEYIASATSSDPNYYVKNAQITFVIQKAKNEWITPLAVHDIFTSGVPDFQASPRHGEVIYQFYTEDGTKIESPEHTPGAYYCVASVEESQNYLALSSEKCRFLVIEVVAISLEASVHPDACVAYRTLSPDDISVILIYNDGTRLPLAQYTVFYQSASSLRCKDTAVLVTYGELSCSAHVQVLRATLHPEDIVLSDVGAVYTGEPIALSVLSMPEGVRLESIEAPELCDAGEYEIRLQFHLDEENYLGDGTLVYRFIIEKRELPIPILPEKVYNAMPYELPDFTASDFEIYDFLAQKTAGEYSVSARVKDEKNTCFAGGVATVSLTYCIKRAPLTVKLDDLTVYTDGYYDPPTYQIAHGTLFSGDSLIFVPNVADVVGGVFENENYEITVIEGALIQSGLSSPNRRQESILCFFALVLVLLLAVFLTSRRRSILAFFKRHMHSRAKKRSGRTPVAEGGSTVFRPFGAAMRTRVLALPSPSSVGTDGEFRQESPSPQPIEALPPHVSVPEASDASIEPSLRAESLEEDAFQISFDFFEDGERALSGRMMEDEEPSAIAEGSARREEECIAPRTRGGVRQRKKRAKKRKKRTARIKKSEAEAFSPSFAPWHRCAAHHAERTVAYHCENEGHSQEQGPDGFFGISALEADRLLSDRNAESLILEADAPLVTWGHRRVLVYLDTLAAHFSSGERVDVNTLKARCLIPYDTLRVKVLARGTLSKPLAVYAADFELCAVKMLLLAGGKAIRQKARSISRPSEEQA